MYFLSNLIQDAQKHQTMFGDVPLSYAQVGHAKQAMVDHYDDDEGAEIADKHAQQGLGGVAEEAKPEQANFIAPLDLSLDARLRQARNQPGSLVLVTIDELTQLLEYRDELKSSYDTKPRLVPPPAPERRSLNLVPAAMFIEAAKDSLRDAEVPMLQDQRKELHVAIGEVSLDYQQGYELGLQTARVCLQLEPATQLAGVMEAAAAKLPVMAARCDSWDGQGHQCTYEAGHESDHTFEVEKAPQQVDALAMHEQYQADLAAQAAAREKAQAADEAGKQPETLQE